VTTVLLSRPSEVTMEPLPPYPLATYVSPVTLSMEPLPLSRKIFAGALTGRVR
jgi:hypothetical protein